MTELLTLTFAFLSGCTLSFVFYGSLWLTVLKVVAIKRQPLWLPISLFVRIFIVLTGFFIVSGTNNLKFGACITGFVLARLVVLKFAFLDHEVNQNASQP